MDQSWIITLVSHFSARQSRTDSTHTSAHKTGGKHTALSERTQICSLICIHKQIQTSPWSNLIHQALSCRNQESEMFYMKETQTLWKHLFHPAVSPIISIILLYAADPLHFFQPIPTLCPQFTMVWLFDMRENWQITGWRAVTTQIHVVTRGRWKAGILGGAVDGGGQSKDNIRPACSGLTLLTPTAWLTPTSAMICKGLQSSVALEGLIPSHSSFVPFSPSFFSSLLPSLHLHQRLEGFIVIGTDPPPHLTTRLLPTTHCLICPGHLEGAAGL